MRTFIALLKRETLEHWSAFVWAPAVVVALIVIAGLTFAPDRDWVQALAGEHQAQIGSDGRILDGASRGLDIAGTTDTELSKALTFVLTYLSLPFYWVLLFVSLFALIAVLYDERKDRSVLFWKSMPVSDLTTVLSKYVFVAWIAPLATIAAILISKLFVLIMLSGYVEDGMAGRLWSNAGLFLSTWQLLMGFVLNGLVVLPIFAWFMLVAGYFNKAPFIWAVGIPFWLSIFEGLTFETGIVRSIVGLHGSMPTLPRSGMEGNLLGDGQLTVAVSDQFAVFAQGEFWAGVLLGALFLAGAVYLRATRNQI